jgi:two-component system nitrate/nitrite sensor histidine kinase NarX
MTTTSRSISNASNAGPSSKLDDLGSAFGTLTKIRKARTGYPLYFRCVAALILSALVGLVLVVSSFFLSDCLSTAHTNLAKIAEVRHAVSARPSRPPHDLTAATGGLQSIDAALLSDPMILRVHPAAIEILQRATALERGDAGGEVTAFLLQAERIIEDDAGRKVSLVKTVQLLCFGVLLLLLTGMIVTARRIFVDRIDQITAHAAHGGIAHNRASGLVDEVARLERTIADAIFRGDSHSASADEANALLVRMARSYDYLYKTVTSTMRPPFRDSMLRKVLFSLERALDLENAAIIFSEDASHTHSVRILFSNHDVGVLQQQFQTELLRAGPGTVLPTPEASSGMQGAAVGFEDSSGELGVLLVEFRMHRVLKPFELQSLRITASLLSLAAKLDGQNHEARRVAVLEERAAIARELHDSLAQSLSYMKIQLARLQSYQASSDYENKQQIQAVTGELRQGLDNAYKELRELLVTFRVHMDARGLDCAIESAIEEFTQRSGVPVSLDNRLPGVPLTVNEEFHVLQVVREALSNILHHAAAQNVTIVMAQQGDASISITIDDDGVGLHSSIASQASHHGQKIMNERARNLGGSIEIRPRSVAGTRVRLTFTPKKAQ